MSQENKRGHNSEPGKQGFQKTETKVPAAPTPSAAPRLVGYTTEPSIYRPDLVEGQEEAISPARAIQLQKMEERMLADISRRESLPFRLEAEIIEECRQKIQPILEEYKTRIDAISAEYEFEMDHIRSKYGVQGLPGMPTPEQSIHNREAVRSNSKEILAEVAHNNDITKDKREVLGLWLDEETAIVTSARDARLLAEVRPLIEESIVGLEAGDFVRAIYYKDENKRSREIIEGKLILTSMGSLVVKDREVSCDGKANLMLVLPVELVKPKDI